MILIVARDATPYAPLVEFFAKKNTNTIIANSFKQALDIAKTTNLIAIISEFDLNPQTGLQILDRLRTYDIRAPFFLIVQKPSDVSVDLAFSKGVEAIFEKPLNWSQLASVVADAFASSPDWTQKRKSPRVLGHIPIEFESSQRPGRNSTLATSLSLGGMFLCTDQSLPQVGDFVAFTIKPTQYYPFAVEGEGIVRWVRSKSSNGSPAGFGIEFYSPTDEGQRQITELYNRLKTQSPQSELLEH